MKKLSILIAGLFIAGTVFTSCSKDEESTVSNPIGKATIKGIVEMNSDQAENKRDKDGNLIETDGIVWEYPAGVQLTATIDATELVQDPNNQVTYPKKAYYTTVGSDGTYEFTIDAGYENVNVAITGIELRKDLITYRQFDSNGGWQDSVMTDNTPVYEVITDDRKVWTMATQNIQLTEKHVAIHDFKYN